MRRQKNLFQMKLQGKKKLKKQFNINNLPNKEFRQSAIRTLTELGKRIMRIFTRNTKILKKKKRNEPELKKKNNN